MIVPNSCKKLTVRYQSSCTVACVNLKHCAGRSREASTLSTTRQRRMTIDRETESYGISVISLRENLEVLAVDEIVIVNQQIAGVFHFASDLVFLNSVTE